jgi:hypothetical protein
MLSKLMCCQSRARQTSQLPLCRNRGAAVCQGCNRYGLASSPLPEAKTSCDMLIHHASIATLQGRSSDGEGRGGGWRMEDGGMGVGQIEGDGHFVRRRRSTPHQHQHQHHPGPLHSLLMAQALLHFVYLSVRLLVCSSVPLYFSRRHCTMSSCLHLLPCHLLRCSCRRPHLDCHTNRKCPATPRKTMAITVLISPHGTPPTASRRAHSIQHGSWPGPMAVSLLSRYPCCYHLAAHQNTTSSIVNRPHPRG